MPAVCFRCIEDKYLSRMILTTGEAGECDLCKKERKRVFTAARLAEVIAPIMKEHFRIGGEVMVSGEDDKDYWEQKGELLSHWMQDVIGTYLGFEDEVAEELSRQEDVDWRDGEIGFFDTSQNYVEEPIYTYAWRKAWEEVATSLRHQHRFFNKAATSFFNDLFSGLEELRYWGEGEHKGVVVELAAESEIYRARICDSSSLLKDAFTTPEKTVGPPPSNLARAGRMNVEGVSVLYGARDFDTCIAELRPAIGSHVAAIQFKTNKPLRILDFTRLDKCSADLSYFQPDFAEEAARLKFLRQLGKRISEPIIPGREAEYIITQCLAEYLNHVHEKPFDGIFFGSAQRAEGVNVTLFDKQTEANILFPITYVPESLTIVKVASVAYKSQKQYLRLDGEGEVSKEWWFDEEDEYE